MGDSLDSDGVDLMLAMLAYDPNKRISVRHVTCHTAYPV